MLFDPSTDGLWKAVSKQTGEAEATIREAIARYAFRGPYASAESDRLLFQEVEIMISRRPDLAGRARKKTSKP